MTALLYDLLYMLPLVVSAVVLGTPYIGGPDNNVVTSLCGAVVLVIFIIMKHGKSRLKYLVPAGVLVLGAGVLLIHSPDEWGDLLLNSRWIGWILLISAAVIGVGWLILVSHMIKRVFGLLVCAALIFVMVMQWPVNKAVVGLALFIIVLIAVDEIQYKWKKSGYPDRKGHLVSIAPFLLVLGLTVCLLPAPDKPYDWSFAARIWEKATDLIQWTGRLFHGSDEDYSAVVGFSESGTFWGNLSQDEDETVMTMSGNNDQGTAVYLRGKVMDSFDGRDWSDTYQEENADDRLDVLETLCAVNRYDPDYFGNYLRKVKLSLTYDDFNTRYLFAPIKAALPSHRVDEEEYTQIGGSLITEDRLGFGSSYTVPYYRMNLDHEVFKNLLRKSQPVDEDSWERARTRYKAQDPSGLSSDAEEKTIEMSYREYLSYRDRIYDYYAEKPALSGRTESYLQQILDGAQSDYDKLNRIESALASFKYTVSPGVLPEDVTTPESYLDYFLLDKKEGYCSYFATAFVLLARSQGIPARYVQGFRVPLSKGRETIEVRSGMSHAWPEAYIDGVGWIPFEPTPGRKELVSWMIPKESGGIRHETDEWMAQEEDKTPEQGASEEHKEEGSGINAGFVILISFGLFTVVLLVFFLIIRLSAGVRYRRLNTLGQYRVACEKNYRILHMLGYHIRPGETLQEFHNRVSEEIDSGALGFITDCELIAYAGKPVDTGMFQETAENRELLIARLKETKHLTKRLYLYIMEMIV